MTRLSFNSQISTIMKNKFILAFAILTLVVLVSSCASQKYGCPGNPQASSKFRG